MGIFMLVLIIMLVVCGPLLSIWVLNTLFGLGIGYTLKTWFAALVLGAIMAPSKQSNKG